MRSVGYKSVTMRCPVIRVTNQSQFVALCVCYALTDSKAFHCDAFLPVILTPPTHTLVHNGDGWKGESTETKEQPTPTKDGNAKTKFKYNLSALKDQTAG